jgi:hypothetical protein
MLTQNLLSRKGIHMRKTLSVIVGLLLVTFGSAVADNLYKVDIQSEQQAAVLASSRVDPVYRGFNSYLVLADETAAQGLTGAGLDLTLVASGVTRDELALDGRLDRSNVGKFPLVYETDQVRLFRIDAGQGAVLAKEQQLFPLGDVRPRIEFKEPTRFERPTRPATALDLVSLINEVNQDSLQSYTLALQAFDGRVTGSANNIYARDWIIAKLQSFGYDSVVIDPFEENDPASTSGPHENVLAYKIGTLLPEQHIVVGAHRDAVPGSPGADDNGSGTAGVLEIARVLADKPTDLTIVFALFDAEETGLNGSEHYVARSIINEENTLYMLNMDMIGHYENYNLAYLYYGDDNVYTLLWQSLADSLVGVSGYLNGNSAGSDHYPFTQAGIPATFVHEYYFSTVYHSRYDSTSYMSFAYMTKMVRASLATVYRVNEIARPAPELTFSFPEGIPEMVVPDYPTFFSIDVKPEWGSEVVPGSVEMHYSIDQGESYVDVPLTNVSGDQYLVSVPGLSCGAVIMFYFTAEEATVGTRYDHGAQWPYYAHVATGYTDNFHDDFELYRGWVETYTQAYTGFWTRGVPVCDFASDYDPHTDGDGSGQCYVTGNHLTEDVDEGRVTLWSPTLNLSEGGTIVYDYFFATSGYSPETDYLMVQVTGQYGTDPWVEIRRYTDNVGPHWRYDEITSDELLAAGVNLTTSTRVRFICADGYPENTVEGGVDGFAVRHFQCETMACCGQFTGGYTGNTDCDPQGDIDLSDITRLIDHVYIGHAALCCPANGNVDGDLQNDINLSDITWLIDNIYISHKPTAVCH